MKQSYKPLIIANNQIFLNEVDSTNTYLFDLVSKNKPLEGLVVYTDYQSQGRGQIGSNWESSKGQNILTSILLRPNFIAFADVFMLNIIISLGVRAILEDALGREDGIKIKWPNDIYVDGKKICGILIQNIFSGTNTMDTVVGIGLNINQINFQTPNATSIHKILKKQVDIDVIRMGLYYYIEQYYNILKIKKDRHLHAQYESYLYQKDIVRRYQDTQTEEVFQGIILGVENNGQLIVQKNDAIKRYSFKEVKYL